jgi:hypothetical protein
VPNLAQFSITLCQLPMQLVFVAQFTLDNLSKVIRSHGSHPIGMTYPLCSPKRSELQIHLGTTCTGFYHERTSYTQMVKLKCLREMSQCLPGVLYV